MEYKSISELRGNISSKRAEDFKDLFFSVPRERNYNLPDLVNLTVIFHEFHIHTFKEEDGERMIVKFSFPDKPEEYNTFVTAAVLADRLKQDKEFLPFKAKIIRKPSKANKSHKYIAYE